MNKEKTKALILGAGGYGKELRALLDLDFKEIPYRFKGFLDDAVLEKFKYGDSVQIKNELLYPIFLGIGFPAVRKKIIEKSHPNNTFPSLIHPMALLEGPDIKLGKGTQILAYSIVSNETDIGDFTIVHRLCSLSHDTQIGDFCTLMPGVKITGGAFIGDEVYIGANTVISTYQEIQSGTTIPAGTIL